MARGLRGRARNRLSNLGHLKKFSGLELLRKDLHFQQMFGRGVTFHTKKVGLYVDNMFKTWDMSDMNHVWPCLHE